VWEKIGGNFGSVAKDLSTGLDGHQYFVPLYQYPWVVFYRKSLFKKNGYTVPTTWDAWLALCKKMKKDGLIPIAFGDKDGWPALGTFDILNMRING
ncbi:extracellular solute-binding protein, partial [Streptomyces sp. SID11233]|nr:extracellular solute-binding protein [Streptomyces sp. SID11233]